MLAGPVAASHGPWGVLILKVFTWVLVGPVADVHGPLGVVIGRGYGWVLAGPTARTVGKGVFPVGVALVSSRVFAGILGLLRHLARGTPG